MNRSGLVVSLLICAVSCTADIDPPGAIVKEGIPLLAGLSSYATEQEARQMIGIDAHNWREVARTPHPPSDQRPRLDQLTIDADVVECGQDGTLRLRFFNDRLESTIFTPRQWEACGVDLERQGIQLKGAVVGDRRVWSDVDEKGRRFVGMADERLRREVSEWIRRYS
jgi:hypothetical protein